MDGPIDYWSQIAPIDLGAAFTAGQQGAQQRLLQQQQLQRAQQQQALLDAARLRAIRSPSAENYAALQVLDPEHFKDIKNAYDITDKAEQTRTLQDLSAVRGYLRAGQGDRAKALIQRRIDADRAAGLDTSDDEDMLASIDEDASQAAGAVDYQIAAIMGPEKWSDTFGKITDAARADAKLPGEIAKTEADTASTLATTAKTVEETAQVAPNAEAQRAKWTSDADVAAQRLGLDREKFNSDREIALQRLEIDLSALPPGAATAVNGAVTAAVASRQLANRARGLADQLQAAPNVGGKTGATWAKWYTDLTGDASAVTQLRREYQQLRSQQAVKNLPPGPASDKDIQLALKGFPSDTDNRQTLVSFLRGMEKLNNAVAEQQDRQADWLNGNKGSLGPARTGFFVGNTYVAPGTRFDDIEKGIRRQQAQEAAAARMNR